MLLRKFLAILGVLPLLLAPLSGQAAPLYTVSLLSGVDFAPTGMNNAGQIVGFAGVGDGTVHAMLYSGGVLSDLGNLGGQDSYANAINDAGTVTGTARSALGAERAFLYQDGSVLYLGTGTGTAAYGINAHGDVVGSKQTPGGVSGFLYSAGKFTDIDTGGAARDFVAVGINDHGAMAGDASNGPNNGSRHPVLYQDGVVHDLGALGDDTFAGAVAINNAGQIAGHSGARGAFTHAFLYDQGVMRDLGGFGEGTLDVHDLNEHGTLVGTAFTEEEGLIPFMSLGDLLVDLNTLIDPALGWHLFSAYANNDLGQIVGYGCQGDACGLVRLDLASAVPEPGVAWLLLPGLLVLGFARRSKARCTTPLGIA